MREQRFVIGKGGSTAEAVHLLQTAAEQFDTEVIIKRHMRRRSEQQNRLLWSLYGDILRIGGEAMRGWTAEDIHELMLGEHFGWTEMRIGKHRRKKPARRSSVLNTNEFSDFVDFIVRYMAEQGVVLQLPGDMP